MASRFNLDFSGMQSPVSPAGAVVDNIDVDGERRKVVQFLGTTQQSAAWQFRVPADFTGPFTIAYQYAMATGTADNAQWRCEVEAVTPGDALNLGAATSYDTANDAAADTVPGTAGFLAETVPDDLDNDDGAAIGDLIRFRITYLTASTAAGSADLLQAAISDAA